MPDINYILITSYSPARTSGRGLRTCGIIDALARNARVTVMYVPFGEEAPAADLVANDRITLLPITPSRGLRRLLLALSAVMHGAPWGLAKTVSPEIVQAVLRAGPRDRIIADGPTVATALLPAARHRNLIYLAHNLESSFRGTRVLQRFERRILQTFDESWMATQADIDQARGLAGRSLSARYVPNVVDVSALPISNVRSDACNVLFVADFSYPPNRRGLTYLVDEVMPLVWDRRPEAKLLVVGRGLEQPPEDSRVRAFGFVEDLEVVYAQASCVAVPLLEGGGSPLKFIEAMAHGLPVIATPRAAAGLMAVANEHFRQAEGTDSFAQALVDVLSDGGHELGVHARKLAERSYSIEALADILADHTEGQPGHKRHESAQPNPASPRTKMHAVNERPLRVVSVQTSHERGGGEYANIDVLNGLQTRGVDVMLLTNQPSLVEGTEVPVVQIDLGPKLRRTTFRHVALDFPRLVLRLRNALKREAQRKPIDVLLLHYKKEQLMSALLPRRLTGAVIWAEWGRLPEPVADTPARLIYLAAARRAKLIVAVSESTRDSLVNAGVPAAKVVVVHNIVDGQAIVFDPSARERYRVEWNVAEGDFVLGCVTRLNTKKRNDVIIDALAYLPENVLLVFAGEGDNEQALRARAAPYGSRVRFLPTPRGYVGELLSACDVAVFAPQRTEGAPRSIIFGQLSERAVVASAPEGATGMVLPGTGTIVSPANDPRALAECIDTYRSDPERCAREGKAGRALALSLYDPEVVIEEWLALLRTTSNRAL